ncbi:MAG TPA: molybdate ABC transporter substrate-binding protein, partial [Longimicrobiales bacterium]|nr:molybdate ABC transporter substrate-binding protein [Longimicrobiales bacterium]
LRAQILEGAPVDVYASANMANMDRIEAAGAAAGTPRIFAWNRLQIAVPRGNPAGVTGLADLAREELLVGLCAREVPCGTFARTALSRAGIVPAVDTEEPDVRALLTKVGLGELDAAVTYATDVAASDAVDGIAIPGSLNVDATYPVVVLAGAPNPAVARAFVDHVLSAAGRASLARFGFLVP